VREAGLILRQRLSVARKWSTVHGRILARNSLAGARIASAWTASTLREAGLGLALALKRTAVTVRLFARAARVEARRASSWGAAHSRTAAVVLKRNMADGAAWSSAKAKTTAQASIAASRIGYSWAALRMRQASNGFFRATRPVADQNHRALVVRRSTAIICFEPKRGGHPALRAG
jgi:hypothetical protein